MVNKKDESRKAGIKLATIIAVLFVPVSVLAFYVVREFWNDYRFLRRETVGMEIIQQLRPVLFKVAKDEDASDMLAEIKKTTLRNAKEIGAEDDLNTLLNATLGQKDVSLRLKSLKDAIAAIGTKSNLILDSEAESYHLISASVLSLPDVVRDTKDLQVDIHSALDTNGIDLHESLSLNMKLGRAWGGLERAQEAVKSAQKYAAQPEIYARINLPLAEIGEHMKIVQHASSGMALSSQLTSRENMASISSNSAHILIDTDEAWTTANSQITRLLIQRLTLLKTRMLVAAMICISCVLIGIGLAFNMFLSTLRKLDEVEDARKSAEVARAETEVINGEVANLNRNLAEKIAHLKSAQQELISKGRMEQLGQLTATIAHEIRNPLGAVRTSAFLLERKISGKGLGVESQLQRINAGVVRCDNIITQLLDYSRNKQLTCTLGNLDEWMANTVREIAEKLPEAVFTECSLGLEDMLIPFDGTRLQRAIDNLMRNASEAMVGTGEDATKFAVPHPRIWVSTSIDGEDAVITVRDNGLGISPENIDKVRLPLFTTKSFGTGLGIPAIEQIAHQHGGRLDISSQLNRGASFSIRLPIQEKDQEAA